MPTRSCSGAWRRWSRSLAAEPPVSVCRWCGCWLLVVLTGCGGCAGGRAAAGATAGSAAPGASADRGCRRRAALGSAASSRGSSMPSPAVSARCAALAPASGNGTASLVPVGLRTCAVEGDYRPGATYVCRGEAIAGGSGDLLLRDYRELAAEVDACLQQPIWYPRLWRQGQDFAFAGGERQVIWRDGSTGPKPTVALKIEEDIGRPALLPAACGRHRPLSAQSCCGLEGVAGVHVAGLQALLEPAHALLRAAVRERVRARRSRGSPSGSGRRRRRWPRSGPPRRRPARASSWRIVGVARPDAGEAVGLQLHHHRQPVGRRPRRRCCARSVTWREMPSRVWTWWPTSCAIT